MGAQKSQAMLVAKEHRTNVLRALEQFERELARAQD
jgi:hypothetical protein